MNILKNFRRGASAARTTVVRGAAGAAATVLFAGVAHAAGTDTGVEAGFFQLGSDLTTVLNGAGGFLAIIASVLIAVMVLAVTGRWTYAIGAVGTAVVLGYGVTTLSSFAGVTADVDMVALEQPVDVAPEQPLANRTAF